MAYLDLMLRSMTEPGLLRIFVRFLLDADKFDGQRMLDVLIERINSTDSRVSGILFLILTEMSTGTLIANFDHQIIFFSLFSSCPAVHGDIVPLRHDFIAALRGPDAGAAAEVFIAVSTRTYIAPLQGESSGAVCHGVLAVSGPVARSHEIGYGFG